MDERERYESGLQARRDVLGDAYVDATLAAITSLGTANIVECAGGQPSTAGSSAGPFVYNLTGSGSGASLSLNWTSASYNPPQMLPCTAGSPFAMDSKVLTGAPLFSASGYTYLSDDLSMAKYTPSGSGGVGTCAWGKTNPSGTAMLSWNALYLPPNSGIGYAGGWYLVGQGERGDVLLVDFSSGTLIYHLSLPDPGDSTKSYVTYNTISVVNTAGGARLYDSTLDCPATAGCASAVTESLGRLYAIDAVPPSSPGGQPTLQVAWDFDFEGPSGASPMVIAAKQLGGTSPSGDQIYFDGSGSSILCNPTCTEHPTLFGRQDTCPWDSVCCPNPVPSCNGTGSTQLFAIDFVARFGSGEKGWCPAGSPVVYTGIQAAPALEAPQTGQTHFSVWEYVACDPNLYQFDAQTGNTLQTINIGGLSLGNQTNFVPSSAMMTVTDSSSGHPVMFLGAQQSPPTGNDKAYVLALDLVSGSDLWSVQGTQGADATDAPFNGQFPIAKTSAGGYLLIAAQAGLKDGSTIMGIPLS